VIDSKSSNAGAWIGGGITIDDSLIDKIITVYARGTVTSTLVTINDTRHQISLKDVNYQDSTETINSDQGTEIENLCKQKNIDITIICKAYKINSIIDLPNSKFSQVINGLNKKPNFKNEVVNANN
jgi:hypothetical protein